MYNVGESTTPWARRFDQAIAPYNTNPSALDLQFLGSPIVKEAHARLNPSKIPRPPMRPSDVRPIDEAVQALLAYEPLLSAATVRGGAVAKEAYTILDNIWKWIVYLRPSTANVGDNGLPDNARPVYDGGDIYLGMQPLWLSFRRYLACALAHKEGRKRCLAQSDFVAVTLEIFTSESPLLEPQDIVPRAYSSHRVALGLAGLLGTRLARRLTADICAYDQQNPGSFMRSLLKETESLLSTEIYHSFTTAYTSLTSALLANNEILGRFLKVRPEPSLTEPADSGIVDICHSLHATVSRDNFQNTVAALLLAEHWIAQITSISRTYTGDVDILKEALDGGIVRYLVNACLDPRGQFRPSEWQAPGVAFVLDVLTPALFRPKYLPVLEKAAKDPSVQSVDMNDIQLASPQLARLLLRIPIIERHRQTMKTNMKRIRHCHNEDSVSYVLHMYPAHRSCTSSAHETPNAYASSRCACAVAPSTAVANVRKHTGKNTSLSAAMLTRVPVRRCFSLSLLRPLTLGTSRHEDRAVRSDSHALRPLLLENGSLERCQRGRSAQQSVHRTLRWFCGRPLGLQ